MVTRSWKIYGANGHRQKISFYPSESYDWTNCDYNPGKIRIVEMLNSDTTGTNEYTILRITRDTAEDCEHELNGQISDGIFENARTGAVVEMV